MAKKKDEFYFDNFIACADIAHRAAELLHAELADFHPEQIDVALDKMHTTRSPTRS